MHEDHEPTFRDIVTATIIDIRSDGKIQLDFTNAITGETIFCIHLQPAVALMLGKGLEETAIEAETRKRADP